MGGDYEFVWFPMLALAITVLELHKRNSVCFVYVVFAHKKYLQEHLMSSVSRTAGEYPNEAQPSRRGGSTYIGVVGNSSHSPAGLQPRRGPI